MIAPESPAEEQAFELWKRLQPDDAYVAGVEECAGAFFVPTDANMRRALERIGKLATPTKDVTTRKVLRSIKTRMVLAEPGRLPESMVTSFFGYLMKEGVRPDHMAALARQGARALDVERRRYAGRKWPVGMRALVQLACDGLIEVVNTVTGQLQDAAAKEDVERLRAAIERYRKAFALPGFNPAGTFDDAYAFFRENGCELGRARQYARALRDLWDYTETPAQVEAAGLRMLRRELPRFRELVDEMARDLGCTPKAEAVQQALKDARGLRPNQILAFLNALRGPTQRIADKHVVAINPRYETLVVETPSYFVNTTPSGAAYSLDSLTDHSKEIFMATTDERSAERPSPAELLNLLVHEEYGHCVHGSNSYRAYAGTPRLLDILSTPLGCISEGIAFQRELEFVPVLNGIAAGTTQGPEEREFVAALEPYGGIARVAKDYEFLAAVWRLVRFLRVIGDARINSGKQDLVAFLDWAHEATGLEKATVYYNLFPAHQVLGPGYASTYAIIGERIRAIQEKAVKRGIPLREFNAYACSIGWPPKSVYEAKLEAWVKARRS